MTALTRAVIEYGAVSGTTRSGNGYGPGTTYRVGRPPALGEASGIFSVRSWKARPGVLPPASESMMRLN